MTRKARALPFITLVAIIGIAISLLLDSSLLRDWIPSEIARLGFKAVALAAGVAPGIYSYFRSEMRFHQSEEARARR